MKISLFILLNWWCCTSSAADKTVINYISSQCPYTGGTAVYTARALQASIRKDTFYNDTENCHAQGINYRVPCRAWNTDFLYEVLIF